ncbi:acyl-CoA N-acyltransferase [Pholiota molesta]|nr:acyl-CoA N-acyltransferase [Pholiota molesta]
MAYINSYKPPAPEDDASFQDPYDLNANIPVPPLLETDRLQLVPFIPAVHAHPFYTAFAADEEALARFLPGSWSTFADFLAFVEGALRGDPSGMLFAMIDKTAPPDPDAPEGAGGARLPGRVAGIIGWLHAAPANRALEIGPVIVLTAFQRTFVATHAVGLLLRYALDLPAAGGLGFRRVVWSASPFNERSIAAAEKMGFKREGVMRWMWVLPVGKEGRPAPEERGEGDGRDSVVLSLCWDDWVGGVRELVTKRMERV